LKEEGRRKRLKKKERERKKKRKEGKEIFWKKLKI